MALVKSILLVDWENLVFRYQSMINNWRKPLQDVVHIPNVFVWHPKIASYYNVDIFRVIYYTSSIGDEKRINELNELIWENLFDSRYSGMRNYYWSCQLVPFVFKKEKQSQKSRLVDIYIAVDTLKYSNIGNIECISILSWDGDFKKVYNETMDFGKKVIVWAFSDWLDSSIKSIVDEFFFLDDYFFEKEEVLDDKIEEQIK